jgi:subtilisin family serine protease
VSERSGASRPGWRRRLAAGAALALALPLLAQAPQARAGIGDALAAQLAQAPADRPVPVIVTLARQVRPERYAGRAAELIAAERRLADATQPAVIAFAGVPARRFWIVNALALAARPAVIRRLAAHRAVAQVELDTAVRVAATAPQTTPGAGAAAPLDAIGAREAWSKGVTGLGVRIGSIDTGVNAANPDLIGKVAAWRDFVKGLPAPYDDSGHGTLTIGTMVGGAAAGVPIGVAPGAQVVVAKAMDANGSGSASNLMAAAQWMTDPDGNPATADFPIVVNNSWTGTGANDTWFRQAVRTWRAAGIVPVFSSGNGGPGAGTIGSPASYPESFTVGAVDDAKTVTSFSSRGPVVWQNTDGLGPAAGTILAKPDLAAPGVGIVSTLGTGYTTYTGSSMAAPHVAGTVALVKQANRALSAAEIEQILRQTATPLGASAPNADTGAGLVNALAAVAMATKGPPAPTPAPPGPKPGPAPTPGPAPAPVPEPGPTPPGAASPGLVLIYTRAEAAAAIREGSHGIQGLLQARRQIPIGDEARWPPDRRIAKLSGAGLASLDASEMAGALRAAWSDKKVGGMVAVDEITIAHWDEARSAALAQALASLGPDARRVILYVSPGLVGAIGISDPRKPLAPRLAAILAALQQAGVVQLEVYHLGAVPFTQEEFATYPVRWLARWAPADPGALHMLFGPDHGAGQARIWAWARASPAGRAILANGPGAFGLHTAAQGLDWLTAYHDFSANPTASPRGGDLIISSGGGLSVSPPSGRTLAVTVARPARVVVSLSRLPDGGPRAIAKIDGPAAVRIVQVPVNVRPGRYRIQVVALGQKLRDEVQLPLTVGADWAAGGPPVKVTQPLSDLYRLEGQRRLLSERVSSCRVGAAVRKAALTLGALALRDADRERPAALRERVALMRRAVSGLSRVARDCATAAQPAAPVAGPPPPQAGSSQTALVPIRLSDLISGGTLDLSATLGGLSLPAAIVPGDPPVLSTAACRADGAICLAVDRALLDASIKELVGRNLLTLTVNDLASLNLSGLLARIAGVAATELSNLVSVQRVGDQAMRLVPVGVLADLAGLPDIPEATIGSLQVVRPAAGP